MTNSTDTVSYLLMFTGAGTYFLSLMIGIFLSIVSRSNRSARRWVMIGCLLLLTGSAVGTVSGFFISQLFSTEHFLFGVASVSLLTYALQIAGVGSLIYAALGNRASQDAAPNRQWNQAASHTEKLPNDHENPYRP